jgi:hypothetical protein
LVWIFVIKQVRKIHETGVDDMNFPCVLNDAPIIENIVRFFASGGFKGHGGQFAFIYTEPVVVMHERVVSGGRHDLCRYVSVGSETGVFFLEIQSCELIILPFAGALKNEHEWSADYFDFTFFPVKEHIEICIRIIIRLHDV